MAQKIKLTKYQRITFKYKRVKEPGEKFIFLVQKCDFLKFKNKTLILKFKKLKFLIIFIVHFRFL